YTIHV
ncbi:uncharacterized protein DMAD_10582, partial [Drosophila madeirensis]